MSDNVSASSVRSADTANTGRLAPRLTSPIENHRAEPVGSVDGEPARLEAAKQGLAFQREEALAFVGQVAGLRIWGYTRNDGLPYEEGEKPSWGFIDSHGCLMNLIEQARRIQAGESDPASLAGYDDGATVAELYDTDPAFADAINDLIPGFEYPDWSHRTVADIKRYLRLT